MNKKFLVASLILFFILSVYLGLILSGQLNNFVFSKIINPYNPVLFKVSEVIKQKVSTQEYWEDPRGLFPIFAYNLPDNKNDLSVSLKIIEKGGINILINANMSWIPGTNRIKEAFRKLGSSDLAWLAIIENECKDNFIFNNSNDETNVQIKDHLRRFNDNFIYGWYIWDEPGRNRKPCSTLNLAPNDDYADINRMVEQIRSDSTFNKKLDFINLFPTYWEDTPNAADYEKYIDAVIASQTYKPRVLSFDHYPLLKSENGGFRQDFYSNLSVIMKKSLQYNIPFWMIVLSSGHLVYKNPSFEEVSLQVYSALAYGAKGIGYYLYSKSWEHMGYKSWILQNYLDNVNAADSLHGPLFVPVKRLNKQIQALGKTLLNLEPIEVIHSSDYPNRQKDISESVFRVEKTNPIIRGITNTAQKDSDPKILLGIMKERNSTGSGTYIMAVNKDVTTEISVNIVMNNVFRIHKLDKSSGERIFIDEIDTININILPGSGELFYLE